VVLAVILGIAATTPTLCESYFGRQMFIRAFDRSPYAQRTHLHVVDVMSKKAISHGENTQDAVCEVEFRTNDGKKLTYTLDFVKSETAGYLIHIKPR
jgi:hypothetical protein